MRQGSLLRDERPVLEQLKREITGRSGIQARQDIPLVRETARRQVAEFVRAWLLQTFDDANRYTVEVRFADEAGAPPPPAAVSQRPPG